MKNFVMFGHNHFLGDYIDIIHGQHGRLTTIVQNVDEIPINSRKTLSQRIQNLDGTASGNVAVVSLESFTPMDGVHYVIGFPGAKMEPLVTDLKKRWNLTFTPLIHPTAIVSPTVEIAEGAVLNAGCVIASGVQLGRHVFINRNASIGHDTRLKDFSIIQPGANLAGYINVGKGATVGMGANIIEDITIGDGASVAAGACVTRDVKPNTLVAGVPAIPKKTLPT